MAQLSAIQKSCYEYNDERRNGECVELGGCYDENSRSSLAAPPRRPTEKEIPRNDRNNRS